MRKQQGFGLVDMMATLVVVAGAVLASGYYKGGPANDPRNIDASLPNVAEIQVKSADTDYYLEGRVHKVVRNAGGTYFWVETPGGKKLSVVGTQAASGGLAQLAAGQVAAMQVRLNMGAGLADVFVYKYKVKAPAPPGYRESSEDVPESR